MRENSPAIEAVIARADKLADEQCAEVRSAFARSPATLVLSASIKPNLKFFRRLAGLRNGDLQWRKK